MRKKQNCTAIEKRAAMVVTQEQEQDLFGLLPEPLWIKILVLAELPPFRLRELRLVCKSWRSLLLRSSNLWEPWSLAFSSRHCWVVMVRKLRPLFAKEFVVYCMTPGGGGQWLSLLPLLGSPVICSYLGGQSALCVANPPATDELFEGPDMSCCLAAGAGGLMCFLAYGLKRPLPALAELEHAAYQYDYEDLDPEELANSLFDQDSCTPLVLNVLTGAVNILPPTHYGYNSGWKTLALGRLSMSMHLNSATTSYNVVLCDSSLHYVEVYDSQSRSWTVVSAGDPLISIPPGDVRKGDLFSLNYPEGLLCAYSIESATWSSTQTSIPLDAEELHHRVAKAQGGRVLLVTHMKCSETWALQGFGVWELRLSSETCGGGWRWEAVARTPRHLWEGGYDEDDDNCFFKFIVYENVICMTGGNSHELLRPLVYDLALDSWYQLPGTHEVLGLFAFQPTFVTIV